MTNLCLVFVKNLFQTEPLQEKCDTVRQLISVFNEGMGATCHLKSVILKKGGLKKVGFQRLSHLYNCMGYKVTNTMFKKNWQRF